MQVRDAWRNQHRPASGAATDVDTDAAARRQQVPGKDAEIIVENLLALLLRKMVLVLPERRPFLAEAARDLRIDVVVRANCACSIAAGSSPCAVVAATCRPKFRRPAAAQVRSTPGIVSHNVQRRPRAKSILRRAGVRRGKPAAQRRVLRQPQNRGGREPADRARAPSRPVSLSTTASILPPTAVATAATFAAMASRSALEKPS